MVTFHGNKLKQLDKFKPEPKSPYLVCSLKLKAKAGWRIRRLDARVTAGPLKGAIVRFRDNKIQDSIKDPCFAVYKIPEDMKVDTGTVPFEIVSFFAK